jgi:TfoX-like protein
MAASDSFAELLREQLSALGHITMRRMFGKTGVFCDGLMLGMVRDDALYFRVDDLNRGAFNEAETWMENATRGSLSPPASGPPSARTSPQWSRGRRGEGWGEGAARGCKPSTAFKWSVNDFRRSR